MKRLLLALGVVAIGGLIVFLAVTRQMAGNRADKLDKALMEAEARIMDLEADVSILQDDLEKSRAAQSKPAESAPGAGAVQSGSGTTAAGSASGATPPTGSPPSGELLRFASAAGGGATNLVRIEGTSSVHDWRVVGPLIGGTAEFPAGFPPAQPGTTVAGPIPAKASVFIPVRSMKSRQADGSLYSDAMDEIMYGKLLVQEHPRITYTLTSLQAKGGNGEPVQYEAGGELALAGKTNTITMPVSITQASQGRLQVSGSVKTKMTDFGIEPPAPGPIRTGDEVTLRFTWTVKPVTVSSGSR